MGHLKETQLHEIADTVREKIKEKGSVELSAYFRNNMIAQYNMDDIIAVYDLLISDGKYLRVDTGNMHVFLMKPMIVKWYKKYGLPKTAEIIAAAGLALLVGWLLQLKERQDQAQRYNEIKEQIDSLRRVIQKIDTGIESEKRMKAKTREFLLTKIKKSSRHPSSQIPNKDLAKIIGNLSFF